jgi:hypothetical protein
MISIVNYLFETEAAKEIASQRLKSSVRKELDDLQYKRIGHGTSYWSRKSAEADVARDGSWTDEAHAHGGKVAAAAGIAGGALAARKLYKMYKNKKVK